MFLHAFEHHTKREAKDLSKIEDTYPEVFGEDFDKLVFAEPMLADDWLILTFKLDLCRAYEEHLYEFICFLIRDPTLTEEMLARLVFV